MESFKSIVENFEYIKEHYGDKIYDKENPEFYISKIYFDVETMTFMFKTEHDPNV